jgi:diguanylate cyclase (GGDEF)-like protein
VIIAVGRPGFAELSPPAMLALLVLFVLLAAAVAGVFGYRARRESIDGHRRWATFDVIGRELTGPGEQDENSIAEIARLRAAELFRPAAVELTLLPAGAAGTAGTGHPPAGPDPDGAADPHGAADPPDAAGTPDAGAAAAETKIYKEVALSFGGEPFGMLTLSFTEPLGWNARDERMLSAFGHAVSAALAHARLRANSRARAELADHDAAHDWLTRLGNRRLLASRADAALARAGGREDGAAGCVGLLLVDLDRFKEVNDAYGHPVGDRVLCAVADRLRRSMRAGDVVARIGGDEFAVLVTDITSPEQAEAVAAELADALSRPVVVDGTKLAVEVSVGVACHPDDGATAAELLQHADIAMYRAKRSHPRWRRYEADDRGDARAQLELVAELRTAISGGELILAYQPQLDLRTGGVSAVEALVRWHHPRRGMLTPAAFVPAVEQSGLIQPFSHAILDQALTACAAWRAAGHDVAVSVNVSANNLVNTELPGDVAGLLVARGVAPSSLTLEITETAQMNDAPTALRLLRELRELGVRIAVDDFGTGYSTLTLLQERVLNEVKIDQSFVRRLLVEHGDAAIVSATIQLAHAHGLTVVAEGVENAELLDALAALRCDQVQGLHIGRAMPAAELTSWLAGRAGGERRRAAGDGVQIFPAPHHRPDDAG